MAQVTITSPDGSKRVEDGKGNVISRTAAPSKSSSSSSKKSSSKSSSPIYYASKEDAREAAGGGGVKKMSSGWTPVKTPSKSSQSGSRGTSDFVGPVQPTQQIDRTLPEGAVKVGNNRIKYKGLTYNEDDFYSMQSRGQTVGRQDAPNKAEIVYMSKISSIIADEHGEYNPETGKLSLYAPKGSSTYNYIAGVLGNTPQGFVAQETEGGFILGKYDYSTGQSGFAVVKNQENPLAGGSTNPALDFEGAISKGKSSGGVGGKGYTWVNPNAEAIMGSADAIGTQMKGSEVIPFPTDIQFLQETMRLEEKKQQQAISSDPFFVGLGKLKTSTVNVLGEEKYISQIPLLGPIGQKFSQTVAGGFIGAPEMATSIIGKVGHDVKWRMAGGDYAQAAIRNQAEDISGIGAFAGAQALWVGSSALINPVGTAGEMAAWGFTDLYGGYIGGIAAWRFVGQQNLKAIAEAAPVRTKTMQFTEVSGQYKANKFTIDANRPITIEQPGTISMGRTTMRATSTHPLSKAITGQYRGTFEQVSFKSNVPGMQFYRGGASSPVRGYGITEGAIKMGDDIIPARSEYYLGPTGTDLMYNRAGMAVPTFTTPGASYSVVGGKASTWFGEMTPMANTLKPTQTGTWYASGVSAGGNYFPYSPALDLTKAKFTLSSKYMVRGTSMGYGGTGLTMGESYIYNPFSAGKTQYWTPFSSGSKGWEMIKPSGKGGLFLRDTPSLGGASASSGGGSTLTKTLMGTAQPSSPVMGAASPSVASALTKMTEQAARSEGAALAGGIGAAIGGGMGQVAGLGVFKPMQNVTRQDYPQMQFTPMELPASKTRGATSGVLIVLPAPDLAFGPISEPGIKPIVDTTFYPGIRTDTWTGGRVGSGLRGGTGQKPMQLPDMGFTPGQMFGEKTMPVQIPKQPQMSLTFTAFDTPGGGGGASSGMTPPPFFDTPPPAGFGAGLGNIKDFGGGMFGGGKQPKGYTPSLGGIFLGVTASKAPKGMLSGLEIRPVVTSKKKRKKGKNPLEMIL